MASEVKILLYIIGGIVYFFVTSYNKAKKKENERQVNKRPNTSKSAEDIFNDLKKSLNLDTPEVLKAPIKKNQLKTLNNKSVKSENYNDYFAQKAQKAATNHSAIKQEKVEPILENTLNEQIIDVENFDYRKAVIYSEIFKRPQY